MAYRRYINSHKEIGGVFDDIYRKGEWGKGEDAGPCSGSGSRGLVVDEYVRVVSDFVRERNITSIVDIGCGDFYVGQRILDRLGPTISYIGLDVSSVVIEYNQQRYRYPNVSFVRADAAVEPLPDGDLCLVRQVMQHLSNAEILSMLQQLVKYRFVIVTEHYPSQLVTANLDKPHGGDTRVIDGSAVVLDRPPFNVMGLETLKETAVSSLNRERGCLVSVLITRSNVMRSSGGRIP